MIDELLSSIEELKESILKRAETIRRLRETLVKIKDLSGDIVSLNVVSDRDISEWAIKADKTLEEIYRLA